MKLRCCFRYFCCLSLLSAFAFLQGCKMRDDIEHLKKGTWNPNVVIPLIDSRMTVDDVLTTVDTSNFIVKDSTGLLKLVYRGTVFSSRGQNLIDIPDYNYSQATVVNDLTFPDFTIKDSISLGAIASRLSQPYKDSILNHNGDSTFFPFIPEQPVGQYDFNPAPQFQNVTFKSGTLTFKVKNGLPADIKPFKLRLLDDVNSTIIADVVFAAISPGVESSQNVDLTGKTFSNDMSIDVYGIGSSGTFTRVRIDTSQNVVFTAEGKNIVVQSGSMTIPDSTLLGDTDTLSFDTGSGDKLTKIIFDSASVNFDLGSTSGNLGGLDVKFTLANIKSPLGIPYEQIITIPANNVPIDFAGYTIDFINDAQISNGLEISYEISSNGQPITITSGDSIKIDFAINNVKFSYIEGTLGYHTFKIKGDTIPINIYRNYKGGSIFFEDPNIEVIVKNYFGFPVFAKFDTLEYEDRDDYSITAINGPGTGGDSIKFNAPSLSEVGQYAETRVKMDKTSVQNMIAAPPINVYYALSAASQANYTGFVLDTSYFEVAVDVELPLYGHIDSLSIVDTFRLDVPSLENYDYANFKLYTENGFPLDVDLQLYFYSDSVIFNASTLIDSLLPANQKFLKAGIDNNADGEVDVPSSNDFWIPFTKERFERLKRTERMLLKTTLLSQPYQQSVKFFSDYHVAIKLGMQSNLIIK